MVEALVVPGRYELPPLAATTYNGFVDVGRSSDSMTLAIGHFEGVGHDHCVLDLLREVRSPFSPESVVTVFARTLRDYRVFKVLGDRFGGEWPAAPGGRGIPGAARFQVFPKSDQWSLAPPE